MIAHQCSGLTSKMTCIMLLWTHTHTHTHTKCRQMPLRTMLQCGKRARGKRWDREHLGSPQLKCPGSDTSAGGSSWTQRTEWELGNQLLTGAWLLMLQLGLPGTIWITQSVAYSLRIPLNSPSPFLMHGCSFPNWQEWQRFHWLSLRAAIPLLADPLRCLPLAVFFYRERAPIGIYFWRAVVFYWLFPQQQKSPISSPVRHDSRCFYAESWCWCWQCISNLMFLA